MQIEKLGLKIGIKTNSKGGSLEDSAIKKTSQAAGLRIPGKSSQPPREARKETRKEQFWSVRRDKLA